MLIDMLMETLKTELINLSTAHCPMFQMEFEERFGDVLLKVTKIPNPTKH